jgi:hypothetical protein
MPQTSPIDLARRAKQRALLLLSGVPGVVGVGLTKVDEQYAVKVNLESALPASVKAPTSIDGIPLAYEVVGRIRAR